MSTVITPNLELLDGPLRVIAGPGTGKTHALTELYAELVSSGRATRDQILVLTFSTSAAAEIGRRLDERLRDSYQRAWVSTFHSFCARLVREHLPDEQRLLVSGFQEWVVMRQVLGELSDAELGELAPVRRSEALAEDVLGFVALLKQNLVTPAQFAFLAAGGAPERLRVLARIFSAYQQRLIDAHLLDFRDLVALTIGLLESDLKLQQTLREQFQYVLVDEFQDVDPAQFQLLARIAPPESSPRLAVFGDPDQSIYGFRGTQPQLLAEEFVERYAARTAELQVSRRCPAVVLEGAERLLRATHPGRKPVVLETHAEGTVTVGRELNAADEAFFVAREIRTLAAEDHHYGDFAILLRSTTTLAAPFEEALKALNVPYEVRGRAGLARNQVVRFLLGYLRALLRPDDADALAGALESALAGVGRRAVGRLRAHARDEGRALGKVVRALMYRLAEADPERYPLPWGGTVEPPEELRPLPPALELLTEADREALHRALTAFYTLRRRAKEAGIGTLAHGVLLDTGALRQILDDLEAPERDEALADLRAALEAFAEVDEVSTRLYGAPPTLEAVDRLESLLARAIDENEPAPGRPDAVQVMTVHQAKGLEFRTVFVAGFAHGAFPPPARSHPLLDEQERRWLEESLVGFRPPWPATLEEGVQEEARLAYVAFTRARERLYVTYADEYRKTAGPSGFLEPADFAAERRELTRAKADVSAAEVITVAEAETLLALDGGRLAPAQADALTALGVDLGFVHDRASGRPFRPHAVPPAGADPHHFSATDLNSYLRCPRLYWYEHHPGLNPSPPGPEMERGRFLHQVLEDFHNREEEWRHLPSEAQREWLEDALGDHLANYLDRMEGVLDAAREEAEVRRTLEHYIRFATSFQKIRRLGTIATEKKFILQLDGAEIHGKIDRINDMGAGACEVVDYKTGRGGSMTTNYQRYFGPDAYDVQLALYYLACREGVDEEGVPLALEPRYLSLWFPKEWVYNSIRQALFALGEPVTGKEWLEKQISADELDRGRGLVATAVERIRAGHFAPEPRPVPGTCLHFTGCRQAAVCPFAGAPNE
ncbi:MAG TPA: ATP-dependent DNA helicase [Candidatus Dormibacteraeota bacterium]